jgi:hypothetical protein
VVPTTSLVSGHTDGGQVRTAVVNVMAEPGTAMPTGTRGWFADPAVFAARGQALPTTSPD